MNIREVRQDDDFIAICNLVENTVQRFHREIGLDTHYSEDPEFLKQILFSSPGAKPPAIGFVAERNGSIQAFMCVNLSGKYKNGYVMAGAEEGCEPCLTELIERCASAVRDNGGAKLHKFVALAPGQIRNGAITFWERFGFVSNPYFHAHIQLDVDAWIGPDELNTDGIMLADDHVTLTMRTGNDRQIAGIAYYLVAGFEEKRSDGRILKELGAAPLFLIIP